MKHYKKFLYGEKIIKVSFDESSKEFEVSISEKINEVKIKETPKPEIESEQKKESEKKETEKKETKKEVENDEDLF